MKISTRGLKLIEKYEGCRLAAYLDPVGIWTIGYGHTKGVYPGMSITEAQAEQLLREDVAKAELAVDRYNGIYHWTQSQYDALVSFAYNVGNISQLTANGTRSIQEISAKIPAYNKGGGKVLPGLTKRRAEEQALFNEGSKDGYQDKQQDEQQGGQQGGQQGDRQDKQQGGADDGAQETGTYDMQTIRRGSKGKAVQVWQVIIGVKPDGIFGVGTESQTKQFQETQGILADGIVGAVSWRKGLESI